MVYNKTYENPQMLKAPKATANVIQISFPIGVFI